MNAMSFEQTPGGWTVIDRDAGVLALTYTFTKGGTSYCFAARMADGTMLVVSPAVRFSDQAAAELAEFGDVGAIVANNGFHYLGVTEWRARYPEARVFAPAQAIARITSKSPEVGALEPLSALQALLSAGGGVGVREVANSKFGESWVWARTANGSAWYMSDVLANMPTLPAKQPMKLLFWATKSAPGFRVFNLAMSFLVKDKKGALRTLLQDLEATPPTVIVPAHGDILAHEGLAAEARAVIERSL